MWLKLLLLTLGERRRDSAFAISSHIMLFLTIHPTLKQALLSYQYDVLKSLIFFSSFIYLFLFFVGWGRGGEVQVDGWWWGYFSFPWIYIPYTSKNSLHVYGVKISSYNEIQSFWIYLIYRHQHWAWELHLLGTFKHHRYFLSNSSSSACTIACWHLKFFPQF